VIWQHFWQQIAKVAESNGKEKETPDADFSKAGA
jgi:hypothetical protein